MDSKVTPKGKQKSGQLSGKLGIGALIASTIFLFNPVLNIIDVLPDFFGYTLLIAGLTAWADLCPTIADAVQGLTKLKWFMLFKMFMMVLVPMVDNTYVLVFTFGFALIELIYVIPAIGRIFDGFEYFGTRFEGRSIYSNYKNVRTVTYIFFYTKIIIPILPELCSLSDYDYEGYVTSGIQIDFATYKGALLIIGIFFTALTGIMWLVNIIPYFRRIGRDETFLKRVYGLYESEVLNNEGLQLRRALHTALMIIIVGLVFLPNLWIDEVNVIPEFIGAVFLTVGASKLCKINSSKRLTVGICVVYIAVSVVSYAVSLIFSVYYGLNSIERDFFAYDLYNVTRVLNLLEYAVMFAAVYLVIRELRVFIAKRLGPTPDLTDSRLIDIYNSQRHELDKRFIAALVGFVISFALNLGYILFRVEIDGYASGFWLVPFIATGIWLIYMKSNLDQLFDQVEYKYL